MQGIKISLVEGDAFQVEGDTMILKFAQAAHGLDRDIIRELNLRGTSINKKLPKIWKSFFTESRKVTKTKNILFIGTPALWEFGYKEIREFGRKAMVSLSSHNSKCKSAVLTIHGPGYGLDETEAFEAQVAGMLDSVAAEDYPYTLREIIFVERSIGRAERLQTVLANLFPDGYIPTPKSGGLKDIDKNSAETLRSAGYSSESKKRVFVAMSFAKEFDDHYHYGIYGAVNSCGFICERADLQSFTGDVMQWVKARIASADFVVADLTTASPNVYLEVGYAWGLNRQTILLVQDVNDLKFDIRAQRCLTYNSIKDLEDKLRLEINNLYNQ